MESEIRPTEKELFLLLSDLTDVLLLREKALWFKVLIKSFIV